MSTVRRARSPKHVGADDRRPLGHTWLQKCERLYQGISRPLARCVRPSRRRPTVKERETVITTAAAAAVDRRYRSVRWRCWWPDCRVRFFFLLARSARVFFLLVSFHTRFTVFTTVFGKSESPFSCVFRNFFKLAIRSPCVDRPLWLPGRSSGVGVGVGAPGKPGDDARAARLPSRAATAPVFSGPRREIFRERERKRERISVLSAPRRVLKSVRTVALPH